MKRKKIKKSSSPSQNGVLESSDFHTAVARIVVAQICQSVGYRGTQTSALETLTDVAVRYLRSLANSAATSAASTGRTQCNLLDIVRALGDLHADIGFSGNSDPKTRLHLLSDSSLLRDMMNFVYWTREILFSKPLPCRCHTLPPNPPPFSSESPKWNHIPTWLPAFPTISDGGEKTVVAAASEGEIEWEKKMRSTSTTSSHISKLPEKRNKVLIDELSLHSRLRKYLQIIDSCSSTSERLFKPGANSGDFGVMMEMICSHFLLSISNEGALQEFLNKITWVRSNNSKSLELSVIAARTLLQNPVVLSSPKLLQAHVVSLVSDVISVGVDSERLTSDPRLIDCYLSVFESSVILYTQHMSILKTEKPSTDARDSLVNGSSQPSYESCIDPAKRQKLNQMIGTLNDSWNSNLRRKFFKSKSDLVASSIEYIQQSLYILDTACRDEVLSFLRSMLTRAANDVNNIELPLNNDASLQDICLLASLLMLMSNSLIQAVGCLSCKEYDFIVGIINCFKEFSIRLPIQKFAYNTMETSSHKESRLMLLHFLGLLSLSFDSGLEFLVKSCISVIMALTNLFILEEGNIDAMMSLAHPTSQGSLVIYKEALVSQYPTLGVAAKYQKIRTLNGSNASVSTLTEDVGAENLSIPFSMECVEETCRGEMYLKTRLKGSGDVADFDDLADFVECKKGKDYVDWLKSRDKFRERKLSKGMKRRWEKKKQAWRRSMKGKT